MSRPLHPAFRFATEAQWQACQFAGADRSTAESRAGLRAYAPYGVPPALFGTQGAHAPALTDAALVLWRDDSGQLQRLPYGDEKPRGSVAPGAIGSAKRMVSLSDTLWALGDDGSVQAFDGDSLARLFSVELGGRYALDIAGDGRDGLYVLLASSHGREIAHVDCGGTVDASRFVPEPADAAALVFLAHPQKLVLLGAQGSKLFWIGLDNVRVERVVLVSALRPCFEPVGLGSDGCVRLFLAGTDGVAAGGAHQVLMIDEQGNALGTVPLGAAPTGIAAGRSQLFVTTVSGLVRFDPTATVPRGGGEVRAAVLTPGLRSPSQIPQRWQRIEARVTLPPGCSIEISYGAAEKAEDRQRILEMLGDESVSPSRRLAAWRATSAQQSLVFHGDPALVPGEEMILSAPLHDVTQEWLWVHVALAAAPGGRVPALSELSVLYPGPTLIENLPAIYRSGELESGDFLRGLVGVLEAGTQQLDATIGDLGRHIHPSTAEGDWLDFIAGWLGLPWDDGLSLDQKRRLARGAAAIANGYGTRAGLETLLESLLPERPRRFRIVDGIADFGIATIGGGNCEGSTLPAILSGLPSSATELGNKALLGLARLPCGDPEPETARLLGRIRVDIAADAEERQAWSPWLGTLIDSMLPATTRADLRWRGRNAFTDPDRLSDGLTLESEPIMRLGTDSVTGAARLGGRKRTTLPGRLAGDSTLH